jgi:hypothetical protein
VVVTLRIRRVKRGVVTSADQCPWLAQEHAGMVDLAADGDPGTR